MSEMIKCDKCHAIFYSDSRGEHDDYCTLKIDYTDGLSFYHLCKTCHRQLLTEFMRVMMPEEYDETFVHPKRYPRA